ncbi:MAG: glycosyl transferase family protein [archaeon GW2011_AR17]|nr:MAG: glycosyl transferase family protein [archaeon GW2011_AR17]MBS3154133.1 glycosyltransferase family 2 protein [Candidatus Woesearchaeota archaeon]HIH14728.1 glycosyltransferase family 2 protein [Nanoarchaeota archaeon]HIH59019.1 glycosyltransferase family 2 protein [Nanoarchaeota archaeon]HII14407.1 glycosyltransferase family 2 protein [Nanoarchaeota archaeon]
MGELSIVIPAFNEEKSLEYSLQKIIDYGEKNFSDYEILVINDGSQDATADIAEKFKAKKVKLIQNPKNMGKGFSVKLGMINAKYDLILFTDADLATPIEELPKFLKSIEEGYDIAIASRSIEGANIEVAQTKYRQVLGKAFPILVQNMVLKDFKDTQCGFKVFKKEAARKIFPRQTLQRWAFDVEILYIAKKLGYKIKEIPVTWIDKGNSKLSPMKDSFKMFYEITKIKYNDLKKEYKP